MCLVSGRHAAYKGQSPSCLALRQTDFFNGLLDAIPVTEAACQANIGVQDGSRPRQGCPDTYPSVRGDPVPQILDLSLEYCRELVRLHLTQDDFADPNVYYLPMVGGPAIWQFPL